MAWVSRIPQFFEECAAKQGIAKMITFHRYIVRV